MDGSGELRVRLRQAAPFPLSVEFRIPAGSVTALFGPSGSGKTTVLRAIAGLHRPDEALIACGGQHWTDTAARVFMPAHRRPVGMVFQDYALFPHLTVREQLALALGHRPPAERPARIASLLALVHLEDLAGRRPASLSGGEQQRVALARALARDPAVLLLDEPFAAVDRALRESLRRDLAALQRQVTLTVLIVTHDFEDVEKLATHLVVMERGSVSASGTVSDLTAGNAVPGLDADHQPAVAMDACIVSHDPQRQLTRLRAGTLVLEVPQVPAAVGATVRVRIGSREVILARRRPEGLSLHNLLDARVLSVEPATHAALRLVHLTVGDARLLSLVTADAVSSLGLAAGVPVIALVKAVAIDAFG